MKAFLFTCLLAAFFCGMSAEVPSGRGPGVKGQDTTIFYTYEKDVAPIIKTICINCHGSDDENPSEYYMDDYNSLMKGGKHGIAIVPGKPDSSMFYYKLLPNPPFGKQMPRGHKKITPEAVKVIYDWILQGARKQ